jgi:glucose-6-phosphate 1-dehydrogenase
LAADTTSENISFKAGEAKTTTPDPNIPASQCLTAEPLAPCTLVILGATGDLSSRKLMPALYRLYLNSCLPAPFIIVGCGRTQLGEDAFRDRMLTALKSTMEVEDAVWREFAAFLHYKCIDYDRQDSFQELAGLLRELDLRSGGQGNRLFYLAIPPSQYETVALNLGRAGLGDEGENGNGWSRLVVEKPFGRDLKSAVALNRSIHEHFSEHQIFRIDHYLAKETVQNILMLRFANSIFEPVWNRRYIDHVSITASETLGVEHRAAYYEQSGVLRDMFQNHMMQLLSLTAMEPPSSFDAEPVRDEKTKVFRSLRPFAVESLNDYLVLGQYGPGLIEGREVVGYRDEPDVRPGSLTPTYARMKVYIDNWRWQSVPFYITSGKRLHEKLTEVVIQFREVPHSLFRKTLGVDITANRLTLGVYPEQKISLTFQTKNPGAAVRLRPVTMDFNYSQGYTGPVLEAYEKVLIDCMQGDQVLFWRQDGVELCWSFLMPILEECECGAPGKGALLPYAAGSRGPGGLREE